MISGEIKSQIDRIWDAFWSGGISNPLEVIEQITYLLFLRRLDDLHTLEENKANRLKRPMERRIFPEGEDIKERSYDDLRWSRFKHFAAPEMFVVVNDHVFPFLRNLGGDDSTYAHHMKDARFTIPTPAFLSKVVDLLDGVIALPHWVFKPYASVSTAILLFSRAGKTDSVWFYRIENDGFNNDAIKSVKPGSELPEVVNLWQNRHFSNYLPQKSKHRFVSREEIAKNNYDLCERVYLSGYEYPSDVPLRQLDELFNIQKGNISAAQAEDGPFPFITSSEETKFHSHYSFDNEAICIPIVSSTGHGHASIKTIHYVSGKFAAATITAAANLNRG
jgi:type I restriction-modification system DNA methylase subunit